MRKVGVYPLIFLMLVVGVVSQVITCDTGTYTSYGITDDVVEWLCSINSSNDYNCLSYVKDNESGIVQVNPNYQKKTDSVIALFNKIEDRQFFTTSNGVVAIYFTKDNLLFDARNYTYGVKCAYQGDSLTYEQSKIPIYENINAPQTRVHWWSENQFGILIFLTIIVVFIIVYLIARRVLS